MAYSLGVPWKNGFLQVEKSYSWEGQRVTFVGPLKHGQQTGAFRDDSGYICWINYDEIGYWPLKYEITIDAADIEEIIGVLRFMATESEEHLRLITELEGILNA